MIRTHLTIAIDRYDRHLPLFLGTVSPSVGFDFKFLEVGMDPPRRHGVDRHRRMLVEREFDVAEVSLASYLVAREKGMDELIALPVFPRRLFSHNHIFTSSRADIRTPRDLVGKRVVIWAFQVTMSVLAKGDLKRDHGVDWRDIVWLTQNPEEIRTNYGTDVRIEPLPAAYDVVAALKSGAVDAYINPHPPEAVMTPGDGIERLFPNWRETTKRHFQRYGYFPIMHTLVVKRNLLDDHPELGPELVRMFNDAMAETRSWYVDPGFSMIMHARNTLEDEISGYGGNVWTSGLNDNRTNLEDFIGFCLDQRLILKAPTLEEVFHT